LVDYTECIVDFSFHALREAEFELGFGESSNEKMFYVLEERFYSQLLCRALNANSVAEAQILVDYTECIVDFSFHALREAEFELGFGESFNEKMIYVLEERFAIPFSIWIVFYSMCWRKRKKIW